LSHQLDAPVTARENRVAIACMSHSGLPGTALVCNANEQTGERQQSVVVVEE
jgi:hypothetical protein